MARAPENASVASVGETARNNRKRTRPSINKPPRSGLVQPLVRPHWKNQKAARAIL